MEPESKMTPFVPASARVQDARELEFDNGETADETAEETAKKRTRLYQAVHVH